MSKLTRWSKQMSDFINSNAANFVRAFEVGTRHNFAQLEAFANEFAAKFEHDAVDDAAFPVLVYERNGTPVAWYDFECIRGFVA